MSKYTDIRKQMVFKTAPVVSTAPSVQTITSSASIVPAAGDNLIIVTALATPAIITNPIGTWAQGEDFIIRINDDGVSRALTYDTKYRAVGVTLPTATSANKVTYIGVIYNATTDTFDVIGVTTQA